MTVIMPEDEASAEKAARPIDQGQRSRRTVLLVASSAGVASIGGMIASLFVKSPEQVRADAAPPSRTVLTEVVERRVLKSTVVTRGIVGAAREVEATPSSALGASVTIVTALLVQPGETIAPGRVLVVVSGRPLIALAGAIPCYRDMKPNDTGSDVAQLQKALRAMSHYNGGDAEGHFGPNTKAAIRKLYAKVGFSAPDTGGLNGKGDRAALRAADDAVLAAENKVATIKELIAAGSTTPPGEPSLPEQLAVAEKALARSRQDRADLIASTGPVMPLSEIVFIPSFPATVSKLNARVGFPVKSPLIALSAGSLEITVKLRTDQGKLVRVGMEAEIASETLGRRAKGSLVAVGDLTVDNAQAEGGAPFVPVVVAPADSLTSQWDRLDVRVTFTTAQTEGEVLVVPLSAVSGTADGNTSVTVVAVNGSTRRVGVVPGVSGDGFVQVTPVEGSLVEGERVVVGQ